MSPCRRLDMELSCNAVTEGYFAAAGITLVAGRELSAGDDRMWLELRSSSGPL